EWLAQNRQHKHGVHRYAAEDFGLDESGIAERFAYYRDRFGLAYQPVAQSLTPPRLVFSPRALSPKLAVQPGTAAFRLRALAENPGARSRDGLRHGLLA